MTPRADAFLRSAPAIIVVSDFAAAEFASAVARRVRMGGIGADIGRAAFSDLDAWMAGGVEIVDLGPADVAAAAGFLRRLDLRLRTPDALNLAICRRASAALATFDVGMAAAARALGIAVAQA